MAIPVVVFFKLGVTKFKGFLLIWNDGDPIKFEPIFVKINFFKLELNEIFTLDQVCD